MDEATQSYRERMKAQRAEARAKRDADKAEWHRRIELHVEVRRIAMAATKAAIRAKGDKLSLYSLAQLRAQADAMIGPWLVAQAPSEGLSRRRFRCANITIEMEKRNDSRLRPSFDRRPDA